MKKLTTLLIVLILALFVGCSKMPEVIVNRGEEFTPPPVVVDENTDDDFEIEPDDFATLGNRLAENERVNGIYIGMSKEELFQIVGNADKSDEVPNHSDTDERYRFTYNYGKTESYFEFISDNEDMSDSKLIYAGFGKTYTEKTSRGIGIGSTKDEIIEAYQDEYNISKSGKKQNDNEILVMGDELAGIHFYIDINTNTVSSFILKAE